MADDNGSGGSGGLWGVLRRIATPAGDAPPSQREGRSSVDSTSSDDGVSQVTDGGSAISGDVGGPGAGSGPDDQSVEELRRELQAERERRESLEADLEDERERCESLESDLQAERRKYSAFTSGVGDVADALEAAADGDLTADPETDAGENVDEVEFTRLTRAASELLADLGETVDRAGEYSKEIETATAHVRGRVEDVKAESKNVSEFVGDISSGAATQSDHIDEMSDEMQQLSATIEEIAASADDLATTAEEAAHRGDDGQEAAQLAVDELDEFEQRIEQTVSYVEELDDRIEEIADVVSFINDVAEQTNMLALNANIEAARAGASGNGFEVVANEVKELANKTQEATDEIRDSIDGVRSQADRTVSEIHDTHSKVDRSLETVGTALDALDDIVVDVNAVNDGVQEISDATDKQASTTQEVVDMAEKVGDISQETASEAERAADATSDQTVNLADASGRVDTLEERAQSLRDLFDDYAVDAGGVGSARTDANVTTVSFWHALGEDKALLLRDMAREFEERVDGVAIDPTAHGGYPVTFESSLSAAEEGDPPAITHVWEVGTKRAIDSGAYAPVENVLPRDVDLDSYLDPVLNYYRTNGTLQAMPFNTSSPVLVYNRDIFERAGLDADRPPETFDEVVETSRRLVDSGVTDYGIAFGKHSFFFEEWLAGQNAPLVDEQNGRAGTATEAFVDSEASRNVFEWIASMADEGIYYDPDEGGLGGPEDAFFDGNAAMHITTTSALSKMEDGAAENGFELGTGYFPAYDEHHGVVVGGGSLWVADDLDPAVRSAAGEFLAFLSEPEQQARWHRETGCFPVHLDAIDSLEAEGWFDENPHYATTIEQLREGPETPATNGARIGPFDTVRTIIKEGLGDVTVDNVDEVLERTNAQVERKLGEYSAE